MIKKLIVESFNRIVICSNMLDRPHTVEEVREAFTKAKIPVLSVEVDTIGVAVVTCCKNYYN